MVAALFDTNVLIDYLNGIPQAREELGLYEERAISIVSWMEVMVGASAPLAEATRSFLAGFEVTQLNETVAEKAVELRRGTESNCPTRSSGQAPTFAVRYWSHETARIFLRTIPECACPIRSEAAEPTLIGTPDGGVLGRFQSNVRGEVDHVHTRRYDASHLQRRRFP